MKFICFVYVQYDRYKNVTAVIHIGETIIQQFCTFMPNFHALFFIYRQMKTVRICITEFPIHSQHTTILQNH